MTLSGRVGSHRDRVDYSMTMVSAHSQLVLVNPCSLYIPPVALTSGNILCIIRIEAVLTFLRAGGEEQLELIF